MLEIDFSELLVIMVVALIVIGPERLPRVARTLGLLWGRAQRYVNGVRADIERDMQMEEMKKLKQQVEREAQSAMHTAQQTGQELGRQIQSLQEPEVPAQRVVPAPDDVHKGSPHQQQFPID